MNKYNKNLATLLQILQKFEDSNHNLQLTRNILQENLQILDDDFLPQEFYNWVMNKLSRSTPIESRVIAVTLNSFSILIQHFPLGNISNNIEIAITGYKIAAFISKQQYFLKEWASLQNNLGVAYIDRIKGMKSDNLEIAIVAFRDALTVRNKEEYPEQWAQIQANLGSVYLNRIEGNLSENLEQAIHFYTNSLEVYTLKDFPQNWADAQSNLGATYIYRIKGDRQDNIDKSILHCTSALKVHARDIGLSDWADVQINLGLAYSESRLYQEAIASYKAALEVYTYHKFPERWARLHNNLGLAYLTLTDGNISDNIQQSIIKLKLALKIYKYEDFPEQWANVQHNLANSYLIRDINNLSKNQESAINACTLALKVYTHTDFPKNWADLQYLLGIAYNYQGEIEKSITYLQASLKDFNPIIIPRFSLKSGKNLGKIAFNNKMWQQAIFGYATAIEALETSRSWIKSESRRQEILEDSIDIYQNIIQAYINTQQIDKAFEYCERSRSKLLVDLMASSHLSQSENIPPTVQELLQKYEELQQQIDIERQNDKSENNRSETRAIWKADNNEKIASLETAKQEIWEQLRKEDPILAGEIQVKPLSLSEIQQLIDHPKTAILSFYTTNSDTHIFIITQNSIYLHTCIGEGLERLQNWISQNWLSNYIHHPEKWENDMEHFLYELAERLQLSKIIYQYLQDIEELIIEPHLLLHQIPFAALPTGEYQEYLVDRFLIRYTPSCQILDFCHQNKNKKRLNLDIQDLQYGIVADTVDNDPLPFSRWEDEQIAKMFNIPADKRLIGSSQATVQNYRKLAEQVQILHSCHHAESCLYNPLESQLKLGDGSITLGQLMSPGWRLPDLIDVFLSCCETNLDKPDITDNLLTLSTGFLCAGTISVISSLWQVDDLATALLSIFYYQQRQEYKNRPEALKEAQIKLRELKKADLEEICKELRKADLEEISQAAENQRQQARNQKKQYPQDSKEYLECDFQHKKSLKILNTINHIQKSTAEFPFAHPRYWSAFIAQGLQ
ncbi:CHAT domain-containing protein [Anabaena cylindrica UHCC 0172]|uniref:CHAT domain-containing protein n=1 Tax=Anabaena cylindrica TaxID=1165 RepID=UPI002B204E6E|nr:CHAT domain-containing protein [Anabaena cylindrica]MEA5550157.1 CHAT domain-containing protein [Anabaena cylindrica UHCC 0172]